MSESSKQHKAKAPKTLNFGIYICSTSRYNQIEQGEKEVSDVGGVTMVRRPGTKSSSKKLLLMTRR
jgi:hypothetical protein